MDQGDIAGSLDGPGQHPLMWGAHPGDPAGDDLPLLSYEPAQGTDVLIVDPGNLVLTELAYFTAAHKSHVAISLRKPQRPSQIARPHEIFNILSLITTVCRMATAHFAGSFAA
jgi:hypothetical protein